MTTLPLLLGEQPGNKRAADEVVFPLKGLAPRLMSWGRYLDADPDPYDVMLGRFQVHNVFEHRRPRWDRHYARHVWMLWTREHKFDVVVALGRRAADAVGLPATWPWGRWEALYPNRLVTVVPHPSGRCREYNDPVMRERTGIVLRQAESFQRTRDQLAYYISKRRSAA